ncbi:hypothetical protein K8T06_04025 [bacterium]|nr:hypothetical protein [bacterium]
MKLIKVIDNLNQIEKTPFLKILDEFATESRQMKPIVDQILSESSNQLKKVENENIVRLFDVLKDKYKDYLDDRIKYSDFQLDMIIEIFVRDGNQMMSREWFHKLYQDELKKMKANIKRTSRILSTESKDVSIARKRDYSVFIECVRTAYNNDATRNRENKLSWEEKTILNTLSDCLELSNEETRYLKYSVVPIEEHSIDEVIDHLRKSGVIFYNKKHSTLYIPNEIVWLLRSIIGIHVPTKYLRRILRHLSDPEINRICKLHSIERKLGRIDKIDSLLNLGLSVRNVLLNEIHKDNTSKSDKAKRIQEMIVKELELDVQKLGRSLEEKVETIIEYFNRIDREDKSSLSRDGFNKLIHNMLEFSSDVNDRIKRDFQIQNENVMDVEILQDYDLSPRDLIYMLNQTELKDFCKQFEIKLRGNIVVNTINNYKNIDDIYLENYELIGRRDINMLKDVGITVREAELGLLFEKLTRTIFTQLGFNVDEKLRKNLNTAKCKMDMVLNIGDSELIIVECKSHKDKDYNKYASVYRQLVSYVTLCRNKGYGNPHVVLVANDFSEEFMSESEYDYRLRISLLTTSNLQKILTGFKECHLDKFPVNLIKKDGILVAERVVKALCK